MSLGLSGEGYGVTGVRLVKLTRRGDRHEVRDLAVDVRFEGDFRESHIAGDNARILPADSMKNAVYALASDHAAADIETFALALARHFQRDNPHVAMVRVSVAEEPWMRIPVGGRPGDTAFWHGGSERRVARVTRTRDGTVVEAGIEDLRLLKTAGARFEGHITDEYTTLPERGGRMLSMTLNAIWRYGWSELPFGVHWQQVRQVLLAAFAEHESRSVQHTLYVLARAALDQCPPIAEIRLRLPERMLEPVDLSRFGRPDLNEVFVPVETPTGLIEAAVRREEVE